MKYITMRLNYKFILLLIIATAICSFVVKDEQKQNEESKIKKILRGVWVREDYINSIQTNKSPAKSSQFLKDEVCLIFDDLEALNNDTLNIGVSFNNHEGGGYSVLLKSFKENNAWLYTPEQVKSNKEIEYSVSGIDTIIFITKFSKTGKVISKTKYIRVILSTKDVNDDMGFGIDYITNKVVMVGQYTLLDSMGVIISRNVKLNEYGVITGWLGVQHYSLLTDFTMSVEDNVDDVITFTGNQALQKEKTFIFTIENNTVSLYRRKDKGQELKYKLVREK